MFYWKEVILMGGFLADLLVAVVVSALFEEE